MQKSALDAMRTTLDTNDALLTKSQGRSRTGTDQPLDTALEDCESEKTGPCVWLPTRRCLFSRPARRRVAFLRAVLNSPRMEMPRLGSEWPVSERLCEHIGRPATTSAMPGSPPAVLAITITW
jgi:hypothetical protein